MSITPRALIFLVLLASAIIWPARSEACPPSSVAKATPGEVTALVREINDRGFHQIALAESQSGDRDIVAAPFSTWYLDQFLSTDWHQRRDSVVSTLLEEITKGLDFAASVGANRATTSFTRKDADEARRLLCASTGWTPDGDYDLSVLLSMRGDIAFAAAPLSGFVRLPFFNDGSVSGIRLDSDNGSSLFLFWPSSNGTADLLSILNHDRWGTVTAGFREADVFVDTLAFERRIEVELRPNSPDGFDTAVAPGTSPWDALPTSLELSVTSRGAQFQIDEDLYGNSIKPKRVTVEGHTYLQMPMFHSATSDLSAPIAASQRFSSLRPVVYAVVNRATGCILLMGIHE